LFSHLETVNPQIVNGPSFKFISKALQYLQIRRDLLPAAGKSSCSQASKKADLISPNHTLPKRKIFALKRAECID
jgi:hypothetical protein